MQSNNFLKNLKHKGITPGLGRIQRFLSYLNHPEEQYSCIHIAGTNGKGSVCNIVYSILNQAGYKTGLYTSPELFQLNERIVVEGKEIDDKYISDFIEQNKTEIKEIGLSYFETITALAFQYFNSKKVDYAVLETGMGGRFDATNVIRPEVYGITSISKDHQQFLGETEKEIAKEKAGIIKKNIPGVLGKQSNSISNQLKNIASQKDSKLTYVPDKINIKVIKSQIGRRLINITWNGEPLLKNVKYNLLGSHQIENLSTALGIILQLQGNIPSDSIKEGIEDVKLPGRLEIVNTSPPVYFDVAHNPEAVKKVVGFMEEKYNYTSLNIILALKQDKDYKNIGKYLKNIKGEIYITEANNSKSLKSEKLFDYYKNYLNLKNIKKIYDVELLRKNILASESIWLMLGTHGLAELAYNISE